MESYTFVILVGFLLFCGKIKPSEAFDTSTFDTLRLGDQITSDLLDQIRAFQAILNQRISLGVLVRGGEGSPGSPGPPGKTGGRGTMGNQGPVGENGSAGFEGRLGKTGAPGPPGEPGDRSIYYGRSVNYANNGGDYGVNYVTDYEGNTNAQPQNYSTDQSLSVKTKIICEDERLWVGCKQNEKINITNTFWGRDDFITCSQGVPSNHSTRQYSLDNNDHVLMKVKEICNWRPTCEFYATRLFLDDVTDSPVYKYLRVMYECIPNVYNERKLSGDHTALWPR